MIHHVEGNYVTHKLLRKPNEDCEEPQAKLFANLIVQGTVTHIEKKENKLLKIEIRRLLPLSLCHSGEYLYDDKLRYYIRGRQHKGINEDEIRKLKFRRDLLD